LNGKLRQGPLPMYRIRRVERPTTQVTDSIARIDLRDTAYGLAARGAYGAAVQRGIQNSPPGRYPLSAAQKDVLDHLAGFQPKAPAEEIAPVPQNPAGLTSHVKALGYFLKADLVATCKVPSSAYYSHDKAGEAILPRFENAIIFIMRKDLPSVQASTGTDWMGDPISFQAYAHLGLVAETIASYLRRLGWDASPQYGPSFVDRYSVLLPQLLLAAGIGEVCRIGIVLNPFLGPAYKAAAVLTDMPLVPDMPIDFGLQAFCQDCRICADNCPSQAISAGDKVIYNGYETWKLDTQRCASYNFTHKNGTLCNRCVKSCPWSHPATWQHNLVRRFVMHSGLARRVAVWSSSRGAPVTGRPEEQWWFDLEYAGGQLLGTDGCKPEGTRPRD
jgi:reductive dehalogenase